MELLEIGPYLLKDNLGNGTSFHTLDALSVTPNNVKTAEGMLMLRYW